MFFVFFILEAFFLMVCRPATELALDDTIYWGCILINTGVLFGALSHSYRQYPFFLRCLFGGYILRLFFLIWVQYFSDVLLLPNAGYDEYTFYYQAMGKILRGYSVPSYPTLVYIQAKAVGLSFLFLRYINILFSILAIIFFHKTVQLLQVSKRSYKVAIFLACFLPNYALLSSLLLRESLNILFLSIAGYYLVRWWNRGNIVHIAISMFCALSSAWLHSGAIAFAVGIVVAFTCSKLESGHRVLHLLNAKNIVLCFVVLFGCLLYMRSHESSIMSKFSNIENISDVSQSAHNRSDGGSGYSADVVASDSLGGFLINTPLHIFNFLFCPLPWQWRGFADILAFFMSPLFYMYVCWLVWKNRTYLKTLELMPVFVLIALCAGFLFGWGVSNAGTALRHRDKFIFVFLVILTLIQNEKERISSHISSHLRREAK